MGQMTGTGIIGAAGQPRSISSGHANASEVHFLREQNKQLHSEVSQLDQVIQNAAGSALGNKSEEQMREECARLSMV